MVLDLYSLIQKVVGSSMFLWGLSLLINKNIIPAFFKAFVEESNSALTYITAGIFLTFGLVIVWVYNDWYLSFSLIIAVLGWILVIKAFLWIVLPKYMRFFAKKFRPLILNNWFRWIYGIIVSLLGLFLVVMDYFLII